MKTGKYGFPFREKLGVQVNKKLKLKRFLQSLSRYCCCYTFFVFFFYFVFNWRYFSLISELSFKLTWWDIMKWVRWEWDQIYINFLWVGRMKIIGRESILISWKSLEKWIWAKFEKQEWLKAFRVFLSFTLIVSCAEESEGWIRYIWRDIPFLLCVRLVLLVSVSFPT